MSDHDAAVATLTPARSGGVTSDVFSLGAAAFPQNGTYNYTVTLGALAYWALDAIKNRYLKAPGPLVRT